MGNLSAAHTRECRAVDWATNPEGKHIQAGTSGIYGERLRCPVCKSLVYHRQGLSRRPHFAHFSGNSNQECELYYPGAGTYQSRGTEPTDRTRGEIAPPGLGKAALVWRDAAPIPISLALRLPRFPTDYASALNISTSMGQRPALGQNLTRTTFVRVSLQEPPATIDSRPRDYATEIQLRALLAQFRFTGNFFRVSGEGGILELRSVPLELGESYILVTQRPLGAARPPALDVTEERTDRSWSVYRLTLRDQHQTREVDIQDLRAFLDRGIVPARPRVDVIWPAPSQFDPDGARVYGKGVSQLIVRSSSGDPRCEATEKAGTDIVGLEDGLYAIDFKKSEGEAVIWIPGGAQQRVRFEDVPVMHPRGVGLGSDGDCVDLIMLANDSGQLGDLAKIVVPTESLWRRIRVNGQKLRPIPNGQSHVIEGPLREIDAGAFGGIYLAPRSELGALSPPWHSRFEPLITGLAGRSAAMRLHSVLTKEELTRWALEHKAGVLLPIMLSAFSAEVDRGIS